MNVKLLISHDIFGLHECNTFPITKGSQIYMPDFTYNVYNDYS